MDAAEAYLRRLKAESAARDISSALKTEDDRLSQLRNGSAAEIGGAGYAAIRKAHEYMISVSAFSELCSVEGNTQSHVERVILSVLMYIRNYAHQEPRLKDVKEADVTERFLLLNFATMHKSFISSLVSDHKTVHHEAYELAQLISAVGIRRALAVEDANAEQQGTGPVRNTQKQRPGPYEIPSVKQTQSALKDTLRSIGVLAAASGTWFFAAGRIWQAATPDSVSEAEWNEATSAYRPSAEMLQSLESHTAIAKSIAIDIFLDLAVPPWTYVHLIRTGVVASTAHAMVTTFCERAGVPYADKYERMLLACTMFYDGVSWLSEEEQKRLIVGDAIVEAYSAPCDIPDQSVQWSSSVDSVLARIRARADEDKALKLASSVSTRPLPPTAEMVRECEVAWEIAKFSSATSCLFRGERPDERKEAADAVSRPPWRRTPIAMGTTVFLASAVCTERFDSIWGKQLISGNIFPPSILVISAAAFVVYCPRCGRQRKTKHFGRAVAMFEACFTGCYSVPGEETPTPIDSIGRPFPSIY